MGEDVGPMRIAYFDCFSGAAGDMIVASLLDAGADPQALHDALASLGVAGYHVAISKCNKQGFAATRFSVALDPDANQPHRHLAQIEKIVQASTLGAAVKSKSCKIFMRLAQAEAAVHGTTPDRVHFHEVGAVDAIMDVVGVVVCLDSLGVVKVVCSPIPTGWGVVECAHGTMPVPAPATAELLKGVPLAAGAESGELTTPTGAAVLTTLADAFGPVPAMRIDAVGYGAGTRDGAILPNLLRVLVGGESADSETDHVTVLETSVDDSSGELTGYCIERMLAEGALDAYAVPIQMKKSRCGVLLTVICDDGRADAMERILFGETTTFGIRRSRVERSKLRRRHESVATAYGNIRVKIGEREGLSTVSPEYDDCRAAAQTHGVSLRTVIAAAHRAWEAGQSG